MKVSIGKYPKNYKKERKIKVQIDSYDIWSLDNTLALIILPCLQLLKQHSHGSPMVDDKDIPVAVKKTFTGDTDEYIHFKWGYVLDEMIWAFDEILQDRELDLFGKGEVDFKITDAKIDGVHTSYGLLEKGPNDTWEFDKKGAEIYNKRIKNGTRLFGKYYQGLWT